MDRRFAWLGAAAGAFAAWHWRRRRQPPLEADPAESLRAKLEESRASAEPHPEPSTEEAGPDARRRSIHEDARARIDELRGE